MSFNGFIAGRYTALKWTGRALRYRNYRLFFMGQGISLIGTWMQSMALQWFVFVKTGDLRILGLLAFTSQISALLMAPWAGVVADRFSRHRAIVLTQCAAMLQAGILAALVLTGHIQVWHLFVLAGFLGCVNGFDMPMRQAFVVEMIDNKADLGNAIALNSSIFNGARLVGPAIAGPILALVGAGMCFLLNAVSYVAVIWALLVMKITRREPTRSNGGGLNNLREGFAYAWNCKPIRYLLLNLGLLSVFGAPYILAMPAFARDVIVTPGFIHHKELVFTILLATVGVGALCGAFFLASRREGRGMDRLIAVAMSVYALGLLGFSRSTSLALSVAILLVVGLANMVQMAGTNTLIQTLVDEDKRGRVMSLYTMMFMGSMPLGNLWGGFAGKHIGAPLTVWIGGIGCVLAAILFTARLRRMEAEMVPIYEERGVD